MVNEWELNGEFMGIDGMGIDGDIRRIGIQWKLILGYHWNSYEFVSIPATN